MKDYLGYQGKVCVVTGAAAGMGRAVTERLLDLGADVYAMDFMPVDLPVKKYVKVSLGEKESIDSAFEEIPDTIDCFFGIAGVSGQKHDFLDTVKINFIANKYIAETYLTKRIVPSGAILFVSSNAGGRYYNWINELKDVVFANSWEAAVQATEAKHQTQGKFGYRFSKCAINYYCANLAVKTAEKKIRVNNVAPVITETGLVQDFAKSAGGMDVLKQHTGIAGRFAEPKEMAEPMIFLNSNMASYVSGVIFPVDYGAEGMILAKLKEDNMNLPIFE